VTRLTTLNALVALLVFLAGAVLPAQAHTRSETHSLWVVTGSSIDLTFTVPDLEAKRLSANGVDLPSAQQLGAYLAAHVAASSGQRPCRSMQGAQMLTAAAGYQKYEFTFDCADSRNLRISSSAFFDLVPTHVNFAQVQTADGTLIEQLITRDHETLDVSGESMENKLQNAGFLQYLALGIMHIFTGFDHQAFLLGLILISRRLRDLVFVVTGFTIGHSVTLALAVTGIVRPHAEFINALIGLTIALIGAENVSLASGRPLVIALSTGLFLLALGICRALGLGGLPTSILIGAGLFSVCYLMLTGRLRDAARVRIIVTLAFGLIHGFGFAADLLQMRLPKGRLAELLFGFNSGVEIGQLAIVVLIAGAVALISRWRLSLPRPIVIDVGSAFLVGLGLFWFVSRSYAWR
jgi:hypothetical protein